MSYQYRAFNTALQSLYNDDILQLANEKKPPFKFNDKLFKNAASLVYDNGGFDISLIEDPAARALINETQRVLTLAIDSGLPHEVPETVRYALENNAFVFSGFKTFHTMREIGLSMVTDDGNIKPFNRFLADVKKINKQYNHHYLYAEYNHAVGTSLMAAKWHHFQQDDDRYNLQYRTAGDSHVREDHALLHGTTLPPSDPFWDKYYPPNGWNCRCTVEQVLKDDHPLSDPTLAMQRGDNCTAGVKQQIFRYNPGKTMQLFPPKHPYRKAPKEAKIMIEDVARREHNRTIYERLKNAPDYTNVEFDEARGGVKATHIGHVNHNPDKAEKFFNGLTSDDLERLCQEQLFRMGHSAILRNESVILPNGNYKTSLDLGLDGVIMDIRSITQNNEIGYGAALRAKNKQLKKYNYSNSEHADAVCLYFHDASFYRKERIINGIEYLKKVKKDDGTPISIAIKKVYCVINGSDKIEIFDL